MTTEKKDSWETQQVINHLINDEDSWNYLKNKSAHSIRVYVKGGQAPQGLYESFKQPPRSSWSDVDWEEVALALAEEE